MTVKSLQCCSDDFYHAAEAYPPMELDTAENTLFALPPIKRIVPTTITRITASITAYSAMSWPCSSDHSLLSSLVMLSPSNLVDLSRRAREGTLAPARPFGTCLQLAPECALGGHSGNGPFGG